MIRGQRTSLKNNKIYRALAVVFVFTLLILMSGGYVFIPAIYAEPDTTPPTVISTYPADGDIELPCSVNVTATFSEDMNSSTINNSTFTLKDSADVPVLGIVTYDSGTKTAMFNPITDLAILTTYTATITTEVEDIAGNNMASDKVWSFITDPPNLADIFILQPTAGADIEPGTVVQASGNGTILHNQPQQFRIRVYWEGTSTGPVDESTGYEDFTPTYGSPDTSGNYPYTWATTTGHSYATEGSYYIWAYIYHQSWSGAEIADSSANVNISVVPDTTAPTTTLTTDISADPSGWFTSTPNITLTADEPATTYYQWDSTAGSWTTYSTAFAGLEGIHTLYFYSVDLASNTESPPKSQEIKVDTANPSSLVGDPLEGDYLSGASYTISGTSADSTSGVSQVEISINDGAWIAVSGTTSWSYSWTLPSDGSYNIKSRATDTAGNVETPSSGINVTVDNTDPTSSITSPSADDHLSGSVATVGTSDDDNFDYYDLEYGPGASPTVWNPIGTNPHNLAVTDNTLETWDTSTLSDGVYTVRLTTYDQASNTSSYSVTVNVDNTAPSVVSTYPLDSATDIALGVNVTATFDEDMDPSTIDNSTFTLYDNTAGSPVSGSVSYEGSTKTATFNPSSDLIYSHNHTATVTTGVEDLAGNNMASNKVWTFTTSDAPDTTAPTTTLTTDISADPSGWFTSTPNITLTADEPATTYYQWDSTAGSWTTYSTAFAGLEGIHTLYFYSVDLASNTESPPKSQQIKVDTSPPTAPNLSGSAVSSTQINLWWSNSVDNVLVAGYRIYNADTNALLATISGTNYSFTGLTPNTTYKYYVRAFDQAGNVSNASNTVTITTPSPATPSGIKALVDDMKNRISWNPVTGASYKVYRSTSTTGPFTLLTPTPIGQASYVDQEEVKRIYYYKVSSVISGVESGLSAAAEADFVDMTKTIAPTGGILDALNGAVTTQLPSGALPASEDIYVLQQTSQPPPPLNHQLASRVYDIGPSGLSFDPDRLTTVTIRYNEGSDPNRIDVYWHDGSNWQKITTGRTVDTVNHTISVQTTHFTTFTVMTSSMPIIQTGVNAYSLLSIALLSILGGLFLLRATNLLGSIN